jgi:mitochondrial inner membrane protease subunit 2
MSHSTQPKEATPSPNQGIQTSLLRSLRSRRTWISFTAVFGSLLFVDTYFMTTQKVVGPSMSPTLNTSYETTGQSDTVLILREPPLAIWPLWQLIRLERRELRRGDVVIFRKPHDPEGMSVKRVLALPGDRVLRDSRMVSRGDKNGRKFGFGKVPAQLTVPAGHVFIEGDNWRKSLDSNDFGTIPINLISGRPILRADSFWKLLISQGQPIPGRGQGHRMSWTTVVDSKPRDFSEVWESFNYD